MDTRQYQKVRIVARVKGSTSAPDLTETGTELINVCRFVDAPDAKVTLSLAGEHKKSGKQTKYQLHEFYAQDDSNEEIFEKEIKPLISSVFEGRDATIFTYGPRKSGKTYTIQGLEDDPGLAVLSVSEILSRAEENGNSICLSLYEVDLDHVFDLLDPERAEVSILEDASGKITLKGLSQVPIKSISEFHKLYCSGEACVRKSVQKMVNEPLPRRTHRGLIIHVWNENSAAKLICKVNLIDLAGYEDSRLLSKDTTSYLDITRINKSLYAIHKVLYALNSNETHVPYRESKLMRMLQDSLRDVNKILLITCMSPSLTEDTIKTLSLASQTCQAVSQCNVQTTVKAKTAVKAHVVTSRRPLKPIKKSVSVMTSPRPMKPANKSASTISSPRAMPADKSASTISSPRAMPVDKSVSTISSQRSLTISKSVSTISSQRAMTISKSVSTISSQRPMTINKSVSTFSSQRPMPINKSVSARKGVVYCNSGKKLRDAEAKESRISDEAKESNNSISPPRPMPINESVSTRKGVVYCNSEKKLRDAEAKESRISDEAKESNDSISSQRPMPINKSVSARKGVVYCNSGKKLRDAEAKESRISDEAKESNNSISPPRPMPINKSVSTRKGVVYCNSEKKLRDAEAKESRISDEVKESNNSKQEKISIPPMKDTATSSIKDEVKLCVNFLKETDISQNLSTEEVKSRLNITKETEFSQKLSSVEESIVATDDNITSKSPNKCTPGICPREDKENSNLQENVVDSPPLSARVQELKNKLTSLFGSSHSNIDNGVVLSNESFEPKTPYSQRSRFFEPKTPYSQPSQFSDVASPWDRVHMRSTGMKDSLVQESLGLLNTAGREDLIKLKWIGEKRANFIMEMRAESPEPFKSLDDLKEIGMTEKQIKDLMRNLANL